MQKYIIEQMIATRATRPIVRPTAPPVLIPPSFFLTDAPLRLAEFGGMVGVTVTVLTWPVTVSRDTTGVGVHVIDDEDEDVEELEDVILVLDVVDVLDEVVYERKLV